MYCHSLFILFPFSFYYISFPSLFPFLFLSLFVAFSCLDPTMPTLSPHPPPFVTKHSPSQQQQYLHQETANSKNGELSDANSNIAAVANVRSDDDIEFA